MPRLARHYKLQRTLLSSQEGYSAVFRGVAFALRAERTTGRFHFHFSIIFSLKTGLYVCKSLASGLFFSNVV